MGTISIINAASGLLTVGVGLVTHLISIKNTLDKTGADFAVEIKDLDGKIVQVTGDTIKDGEAWLAAHPA